MSIKTFAIAAAAAAITATSAAADTYFAFGENLADRDTVELDLVVADTAGTVEIYNFTGGETGALLGSAPLNAGANADVRVNLDAGYKTDVIAVIKSASGEVLATKDYDLNRM